MFNSNCTPVDLEYNPSNGYIYVSNRFSDDISVIGLILISFPSNAGPDLTVKSGTLVHLDGDSASSASS